MKRQAANHPKMLELADRLEIGRCFAVGVMETLWTWASEYAQDGAISCSPRVLARSLDYEGDPGKLVEALVGAGFLDPAEGGGWLIHDWAEHCECYVHTTLGRSGKRFADGTAPNLSKLSTEERDALRRRHGGQSTTPAQNGADLRRTAQNGAGKGTTDTDTDTDTLTSKEEVVKNADTERVNGAAPGGDSVSVSGSADSHPLSGTGSPEAVGAVLDRTLNAGKAREAKIVSKAASIVAWTGEPPQYVEWWAGVIRKALALNVYGEVAEHLDYAESCVRDGRTKDLGALTRPGAYVASKIAPIFHQAGARLPRPPRASPGTGQRASA